MSYINLNLARQKQRSAGQPRDPTPSVPVTRYLPAACGDALPVSELDSGTKYEHSVARNCR